VRCLGRRTDLKRVSLQELLEMSKVTPFIYPTILREGFKVTLNSTKKGSDEIYPCPALEIEGYIFQKST
jgi:hypothetical protein